MINLNPSKNILWVWRIRLAILCLIPAALNSWIFKTGSKIWIFVTLIWASVFIFFYWIYYPIKFKKLSYVCNGQSIIKNYGILYTIVKNMPLESIQFIVKRTSPLCKFFGVCCFELVGAGSKMYITGLKPNELDFLYEYLGAKGHE